MRKGDSSVINYNKPSEEEEELQRRKEKGKNPSYHVPRSRRKREKKKTKGSTIKMMYSDNCNLWVIRSHLLFLGRLPASQPLGKQGSTTSSKAAAAA